MVRDTKVLWIYFALFVGFFLITTVGATAVKQYRAAHYVPPVEAIPAIPSEVQGVFTELGIKNLGSTQVVIVPNQSACNSTPASTFVACYNPNKDQLIIPQTVLGESRYERNAIIAHEYMHSVWHHLSAQERDALQPYLQQVYQGNRSAYDRVQIYRPEVRYDELHSYLCTELKDSEMPAPLLQHCVQYLPNRSVLPSLY